MPLDLALALRVQGGNAFGSHPLAEQDPAAAALRRLEAGPPAPPPAPVREPETGPVVSYVGTEAGVYRVGA